MLQKEQEEAIKLSLRQILVALFREADIDKGTNNGASMINSLLIQLSDFEKSGFQYVSINLEDLTVTPIRNDNPLEIEKALSTLESERTQTSQT